jgi:hypothetical protein
MFEMWAKRKNSDRFEYIMSFENRNAIYSMFDVLNNGEFEEAIIMQDKHYVMMKIYEKGKVLKKRGDYYER